jgi:hypothetical protein
MEHFLSMSTLEMLESIRGQFRQSLAELGFAPDRPPDPDKPPDYRANEHDISLVKCVLCSGLSPQVRVWGGLWGAPECGVVGGWLKGLLTGCLSSGGSARAAREGQRRALRHARRFRGERSHLSPSDRAKHAPHDCQLPLYIL